MKYFLSGVYGEGEKWGLQINGKLLTESFQTWGEAARWKELIIGKYIFEFHGVRQRNFSHINFLRRKFNKEITIKRLANV